MSIIRTCRISGKEFTISDQEIALLEKISPVIWGERFPIPLPTLCPEERLRRRAQFKNYFFLHKRKSDLSWKEIISTFSSTAKSTIWDQSEWWDSTEDLLSYWQDIDWKMSFNEQCASFMRKVPQISLDNEYKSLENSEYVNGNGKSKNCYLISNGHNNENCLYGFHIFENTNILNCNYTRFSENCSHSCYLWKSYDVHLSFDMSECRNSWYSFSCEWSQYLLGCVGLKNEKYRILNTPCSETQFAEVLGRLKKDSSFKKDFESQVYDLIDKIGIEKHILTGSQDSSGDFCYNSKNALECLSSSNVEDSAYIQDSFLINDSMDISAWWDNTSLSYDCIAVGKNIANYYWSQWSFDGGIYNFYTQNCIGCSYLFGCSGLRLKSYCIFNKQYSKEDWEIQVKKLIRKMQETGEWGEFWDPKYAWYPYDASYAMTLLPLTKEEVLARGLEWSNYESKPEGITKTIPSEKLPNEIWVIPDDVLNWALICKKTWKPYKIQPLELDMHRRFGISLPKTHPLERINTLFKWGKREFSFDF